jgi:tRNA threonylcarbamoyl adenosine modification protein YeaZ
MSSHSELWLSLALSAPRGSLCVHRWEPNTHTLTELVSRPVGTDMDHSERCYVELRAALDAAKLELSSIDRYLTTRGPGSFTGLRIGFSLIKALAYANSKTIETLSGSEARYRAYCALHPAARKESVSVLTYATSRKIVSATFRETNIEWETVHDWPLAPEVVDNERLVLLDDQISETAGLGKQTERFPLEARMLGETLLTAKSRETYPKVEELIAITPAYFGSAPLKRWEPPKL